MLAVRSGECDREYITERIVDNSANSRTVAHRSEMRASAPRRDQFRVLAQDHARRTTRQTTGEKGHALQTGSRNVKAGVAQQHHRVMTTMNAARTAAIIDPHDTMTANKTTTTGTVTRGAVAAIVHAVPRLTPSTAAVAATRRSTALHAHTATAAKNTAVATGRARLPKRASTTTTHMPMVTKTQSPARGADTEATRISTVTGHATRIASETGATAKIGRRIMTTTARRTGQGIRTRSAGADATVREKRRSATMTTTSIVLLDGAARIGTERTEGAMSAARMSGARAIVRRKSSDPQKTMWWAR